MVSKASEEFPDPLTPVKTISCPAGSVRSTFFRLCVRAPRMTRADECCSGGMIEGYTGANLLAPVTFNITPSRARTLLSRVSHRICKRLAFPETVQDRQALRSPFLVARGAVSLDGPHQRPGP